MAKNKESVTSLFKQMPKLNIQEIKENNKETEPVVVVGSSEQTPTQKKEENKPQVKEKKNPPFKKVNEGSKKDSQKSEVHLRKDGKIDNRFSEKKQAKKYQMSLQPELFDAVNELAFSMSTAKDKVSFNSLAIEALEDLLKKYKRTR